MDVSIIIPYYNAGNYLPDAISSVRQLLRRTDISCEIVICDDGSTDPYSIEILSGLEKEGLFTIARQPNKGPAAARNTAVKNSTGKYLVFLDSDNKLRERLVEKGIEILGSNKADVVYGNAAFFGESTKPLFTQGELNIPLLMARNYIDMCAIVRREVWETTGGFDEGEELRKGQEDWDLWLRAIKAGFRFLYVDEVLFDYRVRAASLTNDDSLERYNKAREYIYSKHPDFFKQSFFWLSDQLYAYQQDKRTPFRSFFKYLYLKYFKGGK
ncbi:MAG: glycosyltransferase [Sphingobacteriaceae bacterium]|nr:MAG: glycosyltransferase [Sphingobacteriaceae bacterium]